MKKVKEPYLKIPDHILRIRELGPGEKMLLAHIYSFGVRGCWQSNQTIADIFMVSPATIRRWLSRIKIFCYVKSPKGYYRTIWIKSLFDAKLLKNEQDPARNHASDLVKSAHRPAQKCATTINNTITENYNRTIASPPPLSGLGRTPATLKYRNEVAKAGAKEFLAKFGGYKPRWEPLPPEEAARHRAKMLAQMDAMIAIEKNKPKYSQPPPAVPTQPADVKPETNHDGRQAMSG